MCTLCVFSVASGNPDVMESTLSSTFQSSSSPRVSPEGMPKGLTRPDSGMLEPGLTQFQRPECNTSNIAAAAAGILASAVSTNSKSAAVDAGFPASAVFAISKLNPLSTILLHRVFLMRWNRLFIQHFCFNMIVHLVNTGAREIGKPLQLSGRLTLGNQQQSKLRVVTMFGNLSLPILFNGCLILSNQQSSNFRCIITWSSNTIIGLSQFSGNLSLQNNFKCTITWLSQFSGNLSLQNKIKCTITWSSRPLAATHSNTNTWLSQYSGNLSLQHLIFWSSTLRRPITNQLQRFNYLVVYPGATQ